MRINKSITIITALFYIVMLTANALANILPVNGYNTGELSDMLPNLFVPSGITFSIWGVIYTLLLLLVIYNIYISFNTGVNLIKVNTILIINFILNTLWIFIWHYRLIPLSLIVLIGIFTTLLLLDNKLRSGNLTKINYIFPMAISVYYGWATVATIANFTALFVYLGLEGPILNQEIWTNVVIIVAGTITVIRIFKFKDYPYSIVIVWALVGIIIKRVNQDVIYTSIIVTTSLVILFIIISIKIQFLKWFFKSRRLNTTK